MATIKKQKRTNVRVHDKITKDDLGKEVPKLLLPAIQVNLQGVQHIKLPVNKI